MRLHLKSSVYLRRGANLSGGATLNSHIKEEDGRNCSDAAALIPTQPFQLGNQTGALS